MLFRATILLALLSPTLAFSQSYPPAQSSGENILDRARQLSDLRTPGSPPFHLKATFSFIAKNLDTIQGTYTEIWISDSQWRRETLVGDARRIEVHNGSKSWLSNGGPQFPSQALRAAKMFRPFPSSFAQLDIDSITDRSKLQCVLLQLDETTRQAFCIDKESGILIGTVEPQIVGARMGDYSCQYSKFQKFQTRWFPRKVECLIDQHRQMEGEVLELAPTSASPDPELFNPPTSAAEAAPCVGRSEPARILAAKGPNLPLPQQSQNSVVTLNLTVDVQGHAQDIQIADSPGKSFDEAATSAVRDWRFQPATCNGNPFAARLQVRVDVHANP